MAIYNAVTGLKRKQTRYYTPRKKRETGSSTVAARMYASQAMEAYSLYMIAVNMHLVLFTVVLSHLPLRIAQHNRMHLALLLYLGAGFYFSKAVRMLQLDSELLDFHDPQDDVGFSKELVGVSIDSYANDNECESKTRFGKAHLQMILDSLNLPDYIMANHPFPLFRRDICACFTPSFKYI